VDGVIVLSIDATLHQFVEWEEPWVGAGDSPALSRFSRISHEYLLSNLPKSWPRGHEMEVAIWTREKFREAR
jgi:hypothetical protein